MTSDEFIYKWDQSMKKSYASMRLLGSDPVILSAEQMAKFALVFFHVRSHFAPFLWYVGSRVTCREMIHAICNNVKDEFGVQISHDQLYERFAESVGADVSLEPAYERYYLDFAKRFNRGHLEWMVTKAEAAIAGAFAAYERLDNIEYPLLLDFASRHKVPKDGLAFFAVHARVTHYDDVKQSLKGYWNQDNEGVKSGFCFIREHQLEMWRHLENVIVDGLDE